MSHKEEMNLISKMYSEEPEIEFFVIFSLHGSSQNFILAFTTKRVEAQLYSLRNQSAPDIGQFGTLK